MVLRSSLCRVLAFDAATRRAAESRHTRRSQSVSSLAILDRLSDLPIRVGDPPAARAGHALGRASIFDGIPRSERDAVVAAALADPRRDRAAGCLVGMAIGDAVGAPLEFLPVQDVPGASRLDLATLTYFEPLNRFRLEPGQWTDDTSMGLCLADSLIMRRRYDGSDVRARYWAWWFLGYNNAFRREPAPRASVGLGGNIAASLRALAPHGSPPPRYEADTQDAGNGSIMRLAAVPVLNHRDPAAAARMASESSYATHPGPIAADACGFLAHLIVRALSAARPDARAVIDDAVAEYLDIVSPRSALAAMLRAQEPDDSLERNWNWRASSLDLEGTVRRRGAFYNGHPVDAGYFGSYCLDGLAMALHAVYHTDRFADAVARCVNFLGDADSTGAVAGQIAGALYGYRAIDARLVARLDRWDDGEIALRGILLHDLGELR
jgi:ADP-ribosyl-[dinitrogen reductase] hydrolase